MEFYESFMKFSFPDEDVFCIEKDPLVTGTDGIKACECVVFINPHVALIEAKSSSPKDICGDKFKVFITDITQKFSDSLRIFDDLKNKKHGEVAFQRLPIHLQQFSIPPGEYHIYLIVHGHQIDWLGGLQDAFREAMRAVIHRWGIKDYQVKVFNEEMALKNGLIAAFIPKAKRDDVREKDGSVSLKKTIDWFATHS